MEITTSQNKQGQKQSKGRSERGDDHLLFNATFDFDLL